MCPLQRSPSISYFVGKETWQGQRHSFQKQGTKQSKTSLTSQKLCIFKILQAKEHNRAPLLSTSLSQETTATGSRYWGEGSLWAAPLAAARPGYFLVEY